MSPSLRKILLLLVLLLIPIFLAGAGFLVYSIINARESGRERIDTAVSTQLEDLDSSLSMVNLYLTEKMCIRDSRLSGAKRRSCQRNFVEP